MRLMRGELLNPVFMAGNISKHFKICVQNYVSFLNNNEGKIGFIIEKKLCNPVPIYFYIWIRICKGIYLYECMHIDT